MIAVVFPSIEGLWTDTEIATSKPSIVTMGTNAAITASFHLISSVTHLSERDQADGLDAGLCKKISKTMVRQQELRDKEDEEAGFHHQWLGAVEILTIYSASSNIALD
jgi:hypothetical protein